MAEENKKVILVAEDEKPYSRALSFKLEREGFGVKNAFNGEEAMALIESEKIDLILLDLVMPKMNGFDVLEGMKNKKISIPTIVLSNLAQTEDKEKVNVYKVSDFFEKATTPIVNVVGRVQELLKE